MATTVEKNDVKTVAKTPVIPSVAHTAPTSTDRSGITWIENDYAKALGLASEQNKPLLIDMWADWCHTCLAMKKGTLHDPGLADIADRFIWLSIDTEDPSSAEVMQAFPPAVWPTFVVVAPSNRSVQATQRGSCSVTEFRNFLDRGSRGHLAELESSGQLPSDSPLHHLRLADRALQTGEFAAAAASYERAVSLGGAQWEYVRAARKDQISALSKLEDKKACLELARHELKDVASGRSSASTDFIYYASTCASAIGEVEDQKTFLSSLLTSLDSILADADAQLSVDDRSDALATSRSISDKTGDSPRAIAYAKQQQTLLNNAVMSAQTPREEMTYVWHQVEVHHYLKQEQKILPWVVRLEKHLPAEYDPPYRRAWLLLMMKQYTEAHDAIAIALPRIQGARRGQVLGLQASIYKAEGNTEEERKTRQAVVDHFKSLPTGMASKKKLAKAKKALAEMSTTTN